MRTFWSYAAGNVLRLDGDIASDTCWYNDVITPKDFRRALAEHPGDLTVEINSLGGDVFAAADIYTALVEHPGRLTVKVTGVAASAASLVAMAACRPGDRVVMSPVATMMVHNPWTVEMGDSRDMAHMAEVLDQIREGMVAAYMGKTGHTREEIIVLLDRTTYMSAQETVDAGFADEVMEVCTEEKGTLPTDGSWRAAGVLMRAMARARDMPPPGAAKKDETEDRRTIAARCAAMTEGMEEAET